jgi:plastocyanin
MPHRRFTVLALVFAVPLLAAMPSLAATVNVSVGGAGFSYSPQEVHIHPGDTVTWTNAGGGHNVAADDGSFRNSIATNAWTFSHTFNAVGRFGYHCEAHGAPGSGMFGTVVVESAGGGGGGGPVKAPSNLRATAGSTSRINLTWTDNATNETGFQIERRSVGGAYEVVATVGPNTTSAPVGGLDPGSFSLFRVRATGSGNTFSPYSPEAGAATLDDPGPCVAGPAVLCLNNHRFKAVLDWHTATDDGQGAAVPLPSAPDSGLFYFFSPTNIEMLIKVLNACVPPFNHYWVFFAATTNVEFAVVVTDTANGKTVAYFNPLNRAAPPVQDINAFATCP